MPIKINDPDVPVICYSILPWKRGHVATAWNKPKSTPEGEPSIRFGPSEQTFRLGRKRVLKPSCERASQGFSGLRLLFRLQVRHPQIVKTVGVERCRPGAFL